MQIAKMKESSLCELEAGGAFLGIACGFAWFVSLPVLVGPNGLRLSRYDASIPVLVSLGTLGPFIASFVAVRYETGAWAMLSKLLPSTRVRSWINLLTAPVLTIVAFVIVPYTICVAPGISSSHSAFLRRYQPCGQTCSAAHSKRSLAGVGTSFQDLPAA